MAAQTEWIGSERERWNRGRSNHPATADSGRRGGWAGSLVGGMALGVVGMVMLSGVALEAPTSTSGGGGVVQAAALGASATGLAQLAVADSSAGAEAGPSVSGANTAGLTPGVTADVRFAPHALGTAGRTAVLWADPGGGPDLGRLAGGTAVEIGGKVRLPAGLGTREVLWVSVTDGAGARYGFVAAEDVLVSAGEPPLLDLRGVSRAALVTPGLAVSHGSGEDEVPAALTGTLDASTAGAAQLSGMSLGGSAAAGAGVAAGANEAAATMSLTWLPDTVSRWSAELDAAGARYGVAPQLLAIVTLVESGGNPRAVSPSGAVGLMQIMPATAAGIARERGVADHTTERLYEPAYNIDFGAYYLAQQLRQFGVSGEADWQQSVELAASAYNGGPGSVQRYLAGGALPAETERYQRWVGGLWRERQAASPATLAAWLAAGGQVLVDRARAGL